MLSPNFFQHMGRLRELYAKYICVCFKAQPNHYYQDKRGKDPFIVIGKNSCDLNLIESVIKKVDVFWKWDL